MSRSAWALSSRLHVIHLCSCMSSHQDACMKRKAKHRGSCSAPGCAIRKCCLVHSALVMRTCKLATIEIALRFFRTSQPSSYLYNLTPLFRIQSVHSSTGDARQSRLPRAALLIRKPKTPKSTQMMVNEIPVPAARSLAGCVQMKVRTPCRWLTTARCGGGGGGVRWSVAPAGIARPTQMIVNVILQPAFLQDDWRSTCGCTAGGSRPTLGGDQDSCSGRWQTEPGLPRQLAPGS